MAELGDGGAGGCVERTGGFLFFPEFLFYSYGVFFTFQFCSDNGKKKTFASYLTVASRAYWHFTLFNFVWHSDDGVEYSWPRTALDSRVIRQRAFGGV